MTRALERLPYLRRLDNLLRARAVEPDITPVCAWRSSGNLATAVATNMDTVPGWAAEVGLTTALADLLGTDQVRVVARRIEVPAAEPQAAAQWMREHLPLPPDTALSVHLAGVGPDIVVAARVSHLIADAADAADVFASLAAVITGREPELGHYEFSLREHERLYDLPQAPEEVVYRCLDGARPHRPRRRGLVGVGAVETLNVRLPNRHVPFDRLLASAARAMCPLTGPDQVWRYPSTPPAARALRGYHAQIKSIRVAVDGNEEASIASTRALLQGAGRHSEGDTPALHRTLTAARQPRLVLTDTCFYRDSHPDLVDVPTVSRRSLDDLRLQWDRTRSRHELRLQYKTALLTAEEAQGVRSRLEEELS